MRIKQHHGGLVARLGLALAAGLLFFTPAAGQETPRRVTDARPGAQVRSDEEYEFLIHRLEMGMSALEELGKRDALQLMRRVTDEVRDERAGAQRRQSGRPVERGADVVVTRKTLSDRAVEQDSEIEVVRKRLEVMRFAVEALVKAGKHDAAESVEFAMHSRKLALEGRRDEEAQKIREKAPDRAQLAKLLGSAARLCREWGQPDRARALAELSKVYADQWRRRQQATRPGAQQQTDININSLEQRIEIVRVARQALAGANKRDGAEILKRFLHVAELQHSGAEGAAILQAYEGLDKGTIIELLQGASKLHAKWGNGRKARACNALAEFYAQREREARTAPDPVSDRAPEKKEEKAPRSWNIEERADRVEILRYGWEALTKAGWETAAEQMGRMIRIGEMQLAGVSLEKVGPLVEGLSMELVTEHLERASGMYREWGVGDRARLCAALAKFYTLRDLGGDEEEETRRADVEQDRRFAIQRAMEVEETKRRAAEERMKTADQDRRAADRRAMEEEIQAFLRRAKAERAADLESRAQTEANQDEERRIQAERDDAANRRASSRRTSAAQEWVGTFRERESVARDRMEDLTKRLEVLEAKLKEVEAKLKGLHQEQRESSR